MTTGQYVIASGTAGPTEQDTIDRLDEFMVGALGWNRVHVVSGTVTDNDRVWYSEGENPGTYSPIYARARGNGDYLYFYGYTLWDPGTSVGNDEISDTTELRILNDCATGYDEYVFVGNKDAVFVSIRKESTGDNRFGGFGYWDTYYETTEDIYPLWVMGQNAVADTFANTGRVRSYGYDPDGFLHSGSTLSGGSTAFYAENLSTLIALAQPNPRDARHLMLKNTFYRNRSATEGDIPGAVGHEVRGEVPALLQFYGTDFVAHDRIVASGVSIGDAISGDELGVGDFMVVKSSDVNTFALGPITDYNPVPPTISNLELWLHGGAVERRGGGDQVGGRVCAWIDLSEHGREAVQAVEGDQPNPLVSGSGSYQQPFVRFDDSDYLAGTIGAVNDYTAFAVARYSVGTERQPVFYIRGAVDSNDYIFGVEFNGVANNSAGATIRTDDSPLLEDVISYGGLSPETFYVMSIRVSGSEATLYVNGDSDFSTTVSGSKTTIAGSTDLDFGVGTVLDSSGSADGQPRLGGDIAEVVVYTRDLTTIEHQTIVEYLGGKYGITVSGSGS